MKNKHGFPQGDAAYERRYIKAFERLSDLLAAGKLASPGDPTQGLWFAVWSEMFNTLIAKDEQEEVAEEVE